MKSWITKTAGWLAIILGLAGYAGGLLDGGMAGLLVTNGMGYIGIDRKFQRLADSQGNSQAGV
jgi:hypothetical protein